LDLQLYSKGKICIKLFDQTIQFVVSAKPLPWGQAVIVFKDEPCCVFFLFFRDCADAACLELVHHGFGKFLLLMAGGDYFCGHREVFPECGFLITVCIALFLKTGFAEIVSGWGCLGVTLTETCIVVGLTVSSFFPMFGCSHLRRLVGLAESAGGDGVVGFRTAGKTG
jgi:hypothetical protein